MSQSVAPNPQADVDRLETAADEAIATCGGDARDALCNARRGVVTEGRHDGAVTFTRTGDPATGDFSDATVIRKFGDVPDD